MTCEAANRYLDLFLDRELCPEEHQMIERHLASCEDCQQSVMLEMRFRNAIRDAFQEEITPASLEEKIRHLRPARRYTLHWAIAAGIAMLAVTGWLWIGVFHSVDPGERLLAEFREASTSEIEGSPFQVVSFLQQRLPFEARPPIAEQEGLRLLGARIKQYGNTPVVVYRYELHGKRFFVAQYPSTAEPEGPQLRMDNQSPYVMARFRDGALSHTLVGDVPPSVVPTVIPALDQR